jgi:hypothetical protein
MLLECKIDFGRHEGSICTDVQPKEKNLSNPNTQSVFRLMLRAKELNIRQCGSNAIESRLKPTCDFITAFMAERYSVFTYPHYNPTKTSSDPLGKLHIGGSRRRTDSKAVELVPAAEYLELITSDQDYARIDEKTLREFDELCGDFLHMIDSPKALVSVSTL